MSHLNIIKKKKGLEVNNYKINLVNRKQFTSIYSMQFKYPTRVFILFSCSKKMLHVKKKYWSFGILFYGYIYKIINALLGYSF